MKINKFDLVIKSIEIAKKLQKDNKNLKNLITNSINEAIECTKKNK